jgi:hypothetical protein
MIVGFRDGKWLRTVYNKRTPTTSLKIDPKIFCVSRWPAPASTRAESCLFCLGSTVISFSVLVLFVVSSSAVMRFCSLSCVAKLQFADSAGKFACGA